MPRYFFHVSGASIYRDSDGSVLADDQAAWSHAVSSTGELLRDLDGKLESGAKIEIIVEDETGEVVATLAFFGTRSNP